MDRALDIEHLEMILNEAGSDDELSGQAIEIKKRLDADEKRAFQSHDLFRMQKVKDEIEDLERVLREIRRRRHAKVLERYEAYLKKNEPKTIKEIFYGC